MGMFNKSKSNTKISLADQIRLEREKLYEKGLADNLPLAKEKYPLITQEILNDPHSTRWKFSYEDYGLTHYAALHIRNWLKEEGLFTEVMGGRIYVALR